MNALANDGTVPFDAGQARRYFELAHSGCDGLIEIRPIRSGGGVVESLRVWAPSIDDAIAAAKVAAVAGHHVYVGVATRKSNSNGTKTNLNELIALFADQDCEREGDRERSLETLEAFPLRPTLIVSSGGGFHSYWRLRHPIEMTNTENVARVEQALRGIAAALGSDPSVAEVARVLRVPGTMNVKKENGRVPTLAHIIDTTGAEYSLDDFAIFAELGSREAQKRPKVKGHATRDDVRPGDAFNRTADWNQLLADRGFRLHHERGDYQQWTRPGKPSGPSVSVIHGGIWIFSSSIPQLDPNRWYDPFGFVAAWDFGGDHAAAARELRARGYGGGDSGGEGGTESAADAETAHENLTDLGNANRLAARHGHDLRYVEAWGRWLAYDGARFAHDNNGEARRRTTDTVKSIYSEAAAAKGEDRKKLAEHAIRSEHGMRLREMLRLAECDLRVAARPEDFDRDPMLLNTKSCVIDLSTGEARAHDRADLLTKLAPVDYAPTAAARLWESFLERIIPDPEVRDFLQRAVGYSLTGSTIEHVLFLLYGSGANGKTTFLETIMAMFGDYAIKCRSELLMARRGDVIPNDVARLQGRRLATMVELEDGRRLAEQQVKELTGGDTLCARFMRAEFFEFKPQCKLWLASNHKPVIRGTDFALWRRLRLIPFVVTIDENEQDDELAEKLRAELPGILAWAVRGALDWQKHGLEAPAAVMAATNTYRSEQDVLGSFLEECCVLGDGLSCRSGDLYRIYCEWCEVNHETAISQRLLGMKLEERGCTSERQGHGGKRGWNGIGIRVPNA